MVKVCIDPGHGSKDPGATNGNRYEKTDVLRLALAVKPLLEKQGISVLMTRSDDKEITINQRCALANNAKCDYFLSIHRDAAGSSAYGASAYVWSRADTHTVAQAEGVLDAVLAVAPTMDRGVKKGSANPAWTDYGVNSGTSMASALLELGFITNANDNLRFDRYFDEYAEAIAQGVCKAVGVTYKAGNTPAVPDVPASKPDVLYRVQCGAYSEKKNAEALVKQLKAAGFEAFITANQ